MEFDGRDDNIIDTSLIDFSIAGKQGYVYGN
jgi:hypothetical protein